MSFQGMTIVLTGASSGIGRITALQLLKRGWTVHAANVTYVISDKTDSC